MRSSTSFRGSGEAHEARRVLALWTGMLAGPLVWLTLLQTNYVLSYVACETSQTWFLHAATAAAVLLVAAAGGWAWSAGGSELTRDDARSAPVSAGTCDGRARWMARFAAVNSLWFIIVILAMSVPVAVLETCA